MYFYYFLRMRQDSRRVLDDRNVKYSLVLPNEINFLDIRDSHYETHSLYKRATYRRRQCTYCKRRSVYIFHCLQPDIFRIYCSENSFSQCGHQTDYKLRKNILQIVFRTRRIHYQHIV